MTLCSGDGKLTIVETALKIANDGSHAAAVAYDTDILVMLLSNWRHELANISIRHETNRSVKSSNNPHQRDGIIAT